MKYYINEIHSPFVSYNQLIVGLFKSTDGGLTYTGGECEVNYAEDCTVLAYYIQNRHPGYEPKGYPHIRERVIYQYFDKLEIGSPIWTESFEADNDRTAIDRFFQEQFDTRFQSVKPEGQRMTVEGINKLKEDIRSISDNPLFNMVSKDTIIEIVLEKVDMFAESEEEE